MKILFLQDDFPPESLGGAGRVAFNLAQGLQKAGHQVYIITTVQEKSRAGQFNEQGLKIFRLYANYHQRWRGYLGLYNPQTVSLVKKIIKQLKPDIVHCHNIHAYLSYACFKIAKQYSQKVFLTAHDVMSFHYGKLIEFIDPNDLSMLKDFDYRITPWQQIKRFKKRYNPLRNIIIKYYLKYLDKIFPVSQALAKALNQHGIKNTQVIHNGIDAQQWQISNQAIEDFKEKYNLFNKKVILLIGRVDGLKGREQILAAFKIIHQKIPEAVLLVAAQKDDYLEKISQKSSLVLTGWLEKDEVKAAYWSSHLVIVPSVCFDAFPTINLEAMACHKPVVGTCFGGTPEIVQDGLTGYIVNPFNIEMLAEKILDLLKNPQKAKQFGEAGYQRVKKYFSLEEQVEKILKSYV